MPTWSAKAVCLPFALLLGCSGGEPLEPTRDNESRARVVGTTRRLSSTLLTLHVSSGLLVTTPDHPFAKVGSGWTPAGALAVGDEIETQEGGPRRISSITTQRVAPTLVYNLTVAGTHAYFVGRESLLVHNVNCLRPRPSSEDLAERRERERERQARLEQEQRERDVRELRVRKLLDEQRRQRNRLNLNDSTGPVARRNCSFCVLATLSDADDLSSFLRRWGLDEHTPMGNEEIWSELLRLQLAHPAGIPPQVCSRLGLEEQLRRVLEWQTDSGQPLGRRYAMRQLEHEALAGMRQGSGNTHLVTYATLGRLEEPPGSGHYVVSATAHAIVAVRRDDGDIVYIDPQDVPPAVYRALPMAVYHIAVFSTDVDWRFNRQLYAAVRDGAVHDSF